MLLSVLLAMIAFILLMRRAYLEYLIARKYDRIKIIALNVLDFSLANP